MDSLDGRLIDLFATDPRVGVLEASRRLGVARGTVQARLDKLASSGVVTGWGPDLSPEALGYPVTGKTSPSASYSTSPTSSLSCSRVRSALSSSGVSVMAAACREPTLCATVRRNAEQLAQERWTAWTVWTAG